MNEVPMTIWAKFMEHLRNNPVTLFFKRLFARFRSNPNQES